MEWDVIVVGSGASGLTAAVRAAAGGLRVLVLEKAPVYGGTTAISGGGAWVPCSHLARAAELADELDVARQYAHSVMGKPPSTDAIETYLQTGPEMVRWLEANSSVEFSISPKSSDWYPELPGARAYGRALSVKEYDGRKLGDWFPKLRCPRREFNAPAGFMIDIFDLPLMANMRSYKSLTHFGRLLIRYAADRLSGCDRGRRLTMGNALVARLLRSALDAGVTLENSVAVNRLVMQGGRVTGVSAVSARGERPILARWGVVLASGGFSANEGLRRMYIPHADTHISMLPDENTGDGLSMGVAAGACQDGQNLENAMWVVASKSGREDGYVARHIHLIDMPKPGCIAVNDRGERFGNEASVHFVKAMHETGAVPAHIVCDAKFLKKYGMGLVLPRALNLKGLLNRGYILEAQTVAELAIHAGIDPGGLQHTVARVNEYANTGVDPEFGKGAAEIDRELGDPRHTPNPCLGHILQGPFYAIRIFPGDASTTIGLKIDSQSRALDCQGRAITGLYAVGLDANSIWRGKVPSHGCFIGPAMVQGYIAGRHLEARARMGTDRQEP
jgi:succinate dehydrogenase/fumarate reductase flavoprotein subunit